MGRIRSFLERFTILGPLFKQEEEKVSKKYNILDSKNNVDGLVPLSLGQCELMVEDTFRDQNHIDGCENCLRLAEALNMCVFNLRSKGFSVIQTLMASLEDELIEDHLRQTNRGFRTQELMKNMSTMMTVVKLGRAVRNDIAIKMKQPLPALYIQVPSRSLENVINSQRETIQEFLNVKEIKFVKGLSKPVILPNLTILGKKLNKRLKTLQDYLKNLGGEELRDIVEKIKANKNVEIELKDGKLELEFGELILSSSAAMGVREEDNIAVSYNTEIDESLTEEYILRELSREINAFRREQNCDLAEIVKIKIDRNDDISNIAYRHAKVLEVRTKCLLVEEDLPTRKNVLIGDEEVQIHIEKQ